MAKKSTTPAYVVAPAAHVSANPRHKVAEPAARDGNKWGVTTGLRLTAYIDSLLVANRNWQLDDTTLQGMLAAEYPARNTLQTVAKYRAYFNAQKHGHGDGVPCVRYGTALDEAAAVAANIVRPNGPLAGRTFPERRNPTPAPEPVAAPAPAKRPKATKVAPEPVAAPAPAKRPKRAAKTA